MRCTTMIMMIPPTLALLHSNPHHFPSHRSTRLPGKSAADFAHYHRMWASSPESPFWISSSSQGSGREAAATTLVIPAAPPSSSSPFDSASLRDLKVELVNSIRALPVVRNPEERSDLCLRIQDCVNAMERKHQPAQTLGFFTAFLEGDWQHLFGTHGCSSGAGGRRRDDANGNEGIGALRLRGIYQRIQCRGQRGTVENSVAWEWIMPTVATTRDGGHHHGSEVEVVPLRAPEPTEHLPGQRNGYSTSVSGTLLVRCSYQMTDSGRLLLDLEDHAVRPDPGESSRRLQPEHVPPLVQQLHGATPRSLFDPSGHAADVTYLDAELRIVRYTGPTKLEGARDIFLRKTQPVGASPAHN